MIKICRYFNLKFQKIVHCCKRINLLIIRNNCGFYQQFSIHSAFYGLLVTLDYSQRIFSTKTAQKIYNSRNNDFSTNYAKSAKHTNFELTSITAPTAKSAANITITTVNLYNFAFVPQTTSISYCLYHILD